MGNLKHLLIRETPVSLRRQNSAQGLRKCATRLGATARLPTARIRNTSNRLAHLENFFAKDSYNLKSHARVGLQEVQQVLPWNEVEAAVSCTLGGQAIRLSRELVFSTLLRNSHPVEGERSRVGFPFGNRSLDCTGHCGLPSI